MTEQLGIKYHKDYLDLTKVIMIYRDNKPTWRGKQMLELP